MAARTRQLNRVERLLEDFARSKVGGWYFVNVAMRVDRVLLPLTGGRISSAPGQQILLLETVGAKSGERRRTPLVYVTDDDHVILIASKAGARRHPAWFHNLKANPDVRCLRQAGRGSTKLVRPEERSEDGFGPRPATTTPATRPTRTAPARGRSPSWCWSLCADR